MPELPDIAVYLEALQKRIVGATLQSITIKSPFLLRTATPPIDTLSGKRVVELRRLGKRICIGFEDELWLVLHLMIAGRLHWSEMTGKRPNPRSLATFDFSTGTLTLTEAGTSRRASLHLVVGDAELERLNPGGLEVLESDLKEFAAALTATNHTLKRSLADPRIFSGIGNAYSDEILFQAQLSPFALTQKLTSSEIERLFSATQTTLTDWIQRLRDETGEGFPEKVTAFRAGMAVHGRYKEPCPRCGSKI